MLYTDINHHVGTPKLNTKEHYQVPGTPYEFRIQYSLDIGSMG